MKLRKSQVRKLIDKLLREARWGNILYRKDFFGMGRNFEVELDEYTVRLYFGYMMAGDEDRVGGLACKVTVSGEDFFTETIVYFSDFKSLYTLEKHLWENALQTIPERDRELGKQEQEKEKQAEQSFLVFLNGKKDKQSKPKSARAS